MFKPGAFCSCRRDALCVIVMVNVHYVDPAVASRRSTASVMDVTFAVSVVVVAIVDEKVPKFQSLSFCLYTNQSSSVIVVRAPPRADRDADSIKVGLPDTVKDARRPTKRAYDREIVG